MLIQQFPHFKTLLKVFSKITLLLSISPTEHGKRYNLLSQLITGVSLLLFSYTTPFP